MGKMVVLFLTYLSSNVIVRKKKLNLVSHPLVFLGYNIKDQIFMGPKRCFVNIHVCHVICPPQPHDHVGGDSKLNTVTTTEIAHEMKVKRFNRENHSR